MEAVGHSPYGAPYGAVGYGHFQKPRKHVAVGILFFNFAVPWILYIFMFTVLSFKVHYNSPSVCNVAVTFCLLLVAIFGWFAFVELKNRKNQNAGEPFWYVFLFIASGLAWTSAYLHGSMTFSNYMQPYFDVMNLNFYHSVNPQTTKGQSLMDMGRVVFTTDSRLNLAHSMGFKNLDTYCVAPIVSGNGTAKYYDFWAVGLNCCSGHKADFACGEFNNPLAHSGLRLMRDDLRPYFRLAVQQAESAYGISSRHAVFLYWMQDPNAEVSAYEDKGYQQLLLGGTIMFFVQACLVGAASSLYNKMQ
jgi:hypothetical protein